MKLLLAMPSPRNIQRVTEQWDMINEDHIIVKHYKEWSAYDTIRNYFLKHPEYTHLVICPDDLIVTQKDINILKSDIERFDFPIITGVANVDRSDARHLYAVIPYGNEIPSLDHSKRSFRGFLKKTEWGNQPIRRVIHAGFPCQAIRRDIVSMIPFESESQLAGGDPDHIGNIDLIFSHRCKEMDIPIHSDARADMLHLRGNFGLINNDPNVRKILIKKEGVMQTLG